MRKLIQSLMQRRINNEGLQLELNLLQAQAQAEHNIIQAERALENANINAKRAQEDALMHKRWESRRLELEQEYLDRISGGGSINELYDAVKDRANENRAAQNVVRMPNPS